MKRLSNILLGFVAGLMAYILTSCTAYQNHFREPTKMVITDGSV